MRPRTLVCITVLALCHLEVKAQMLTHGLPPVSSSAVSVANRDTVSASAADSHELPDDPGQELLPVAEAEPVAPSGVPVDCDADDQSREHSHDPLPGFKLHSAALGYCSVNRPASTLKTCQRPSSASGKLVPVANT